MSLPISNCCLDSQPRFRSMWERYCRGVQAIVFVVDAADLDVLEQARSELSELLAKPSLQGIPLLLLGNKNDLPGALPTGELIDRLDLKVQLPLALAAQFQGASTFAAIPFQGHCYALVL